VDKILVQFQGGFAGKECVLAVGDNESERPENRFLFFPQDSNDVQEFNVDSPLTGSTFRITFPSSTDFYGRIILYHLDIFTKNS